MIMSSIHIIIQAYLYSINDAGLFNKTCLIIMKVSQLNTNVNQSVYNIRGQNTEFGVFKKNILELRILFWCEFKKDV